jgi:hypothetical protein
VFESLRGPLTVGAVEVLEIPEDYLSRSEPEKRDLSYRHSFRGILRGMVFTEHPVGLRIERVHGRTRILFLTWARDPNQLQQQLASLSATLNAHLPKFRVRERSSISQPSVDPMLAGVSACLTGEPLINDEGSELTFRVDPLDAVGEVIQGLDSVLFQVFILPEKSRQRKVKGLEREYEMAVSRAQQVVSAPGFMSKDSQQSTTRVNARSSREAERLNRQIKRLSSRYLGKVMVAATHWHQDKSVAEQQTKRILSILLSGITPADKEEDMKITVKRGRKDFERALAGQPFGDHTILTPDEAVIYFGLPRCDLGLRVTRREEFATATVDVPQSVQAQEEPKRSMTLIERVQFSQPFQFRSSSSSSQRTESPWRFPLKELILIGYAIRNGTPQKQQPFGLVRALLGSHIGVYGNTGSGKTTTCVNITAQAYRNGVVPLVITPGNVNDWRVLKGLFPEFRIFTAGNPDIAPLRYNMWDVPPGVPVGKYIDRMTDVYTATLPNDGVLSMHFDDIFNTMYDACGWTRMGNVRGRPIMLADLYEAFQEVTTAHISYGAEMSQDFYGALDARLRSMLRNDILVDMLNTPKGLTIPELLSRPTIIETRDLSPDDRALLTGALTAGISEYLIANPKKEVCHLLVLEEAHHLLKRSTGVAGYAEPTSQQKAKDNLVEMLRIQRGTGLSLLISDQLPSMLIPEVVKLPSNVVIHTLTDLEERLLVGRQALCTDAQIEHIGGMGVGEAVIRFKTQTVPSNIQVVPLENLLGSPIRKREWTDAMVRDSMAEVFRGHPELAESHPLSEELRNLLRGIRPRAPVHPVSIPQPIPLGAVPVVDISDIVSSRKFTSAYLNRIKSAATGDVTPVALLLRVVAEEFCPDPRNHLSFSERLLLHAAGILHEPKDTAVLADILVVLRGTSV